LLAEKGKKEKEISRVEKEETYRFVPAICLEDERDYFTRPYDGMWQDQSDISVCADSNWNGVIEIIKDSPMADLPGEICKDGSKTDRVEVLACKNWGNRDFYFSWDSDDPVEIETDSLFNPAEYLGHSTNGAIDYYFTELNNIQPLYHYVLGLPSATCPVVEAAFDACLNDAGWTCDYDDFWLTGYTVHEIDYGLFTCRDDWWTNTWLVARGRCGGGHLMFEYMADSYQEHLKAPSVWGYMGICFGYDSTYCFEVQQSTPIPLTQGGGAQNRTLYDYSNYNYYAYTDPDDLQRSDGELYFDFDYAAIYERTINAVMSAPCVTYQTDTTIESEIYPGYSGFRGAYVQDIGEETFVCPIGGFRNKYILMIVESHYDHNRQGSCSPWKASGYGYDAGGVYDHGTVVSCTEADDESSIYSVLCANLNGERIEIDVGDDGRDFFEVMDSLILDFRGTPVYMYGYARSRYTGSPQYAYNTTYIRYGYFLNDQHFQSEIFYPIGEIEPANGGIACSHDVYGSMARDNKYGYGQCAGYVVKETTTKKGAVLHENRE